MTKKCLFGVVGVLSLTTAGYFVYSPVFAENPVNISIVEEVDDGSGNLKPWEDITDAMPGMTYSAIPRVKNDGSIPVEVWMCLSESATSAAKESIALPANTFGISIDEHWSLDNERATDVSDPAAGNCYKYNSAVEVGAVTEPLFREVTLSSRLGNEYENSTFNLHLDAEAVGDYGPVVPTDSDETPNNPDTGANTKSDSSVVNGILNGLAAVALITIVVHLGIFAYKKTKRS